jgi:hypothetical protein
VFASGSWTWFKGRLDAATKLAPWKIHDFRRSAATGWREHLRADPHLAELAINHTSGTRSGVAGTYDRSERLEERRQLLERWADLVLDKPAAAKVITFRR